MQPLPIPKQIWQEVTMDLVTCLPRSLNNSVIMVVVDRLSKYAHFCAMGVVFTAESVDRHFIQEVCCLHGVPSSIVSDRDPVFMSLFWQELFRQQGTTLAHSSAYHPQSDGQIKVINCMLEDFLRCYVSEYSARWTEMLPWAEYHYNSAKYSGLGSSPFHAVYGREPPAPLDDTPGKNKVAALDDILAARAELLHHLRDNLTPAQNRMVQQANKHRTDMTLEGWWHTNSLYQSSRIHNFFHISVLKRCQAKPPFSQVDWPECFIRDHPLLEPEHVIEKRVIQKGKVLLPQVRVKWKSHEEDSTWEDEAHMRREYPQFNLEAKVFVDRGGNDATELERRRS